MKVIQDKELDVSVEAAVTELEAIILGRYPDATFRVERGIDDPEAIHLVAVVDSDDHGELLDLVMDRQMDIQIDDGIPIFVVPTRPLERAHQ